MGFSDTQGTLLLAVMNLMQVFGQVFMGYISDKYQHYLLMLGSALFSASAVLFLWGFGGNFASLIAFAILYGAFAGGYSVLYGRICASLSETRSSALWIYSILEFQRGAASFGSGFLTPALLTNVVTKGHYGIIKYEKLVWFIGASLLASSLSVALGLFVKYGRKVDYDALSRRALRRAFTTSLEVLEKVWSSHEP